MAIATQYGQFMLGLVSATAARRIDWVGDTIKLALVTSAYSPDQDTHVFWSDVSTAELATGNGYTTGGNTIAGTKAVTYNAGTNQTRLTATTGNTWTFTGGVHKQFRWGVLYKDTTVGSTSPLIGYIDFGAQDIIDSTFAASPDASLGWVTFVANWG